MTWKLGFTSLSVIYTR